jgi:xanthine dehydrogenase molybdenum-binding subunit
MGAHGPANFEEIYLKMNSDGTINVAVGFVDMGQGSHTIIAQIVAEELNVDISAVKVITPDTDNAPRTMGPWGSRVTFIAGNATRAAASEVKKQLLEFAKEILSVKDENDLELDLGKIAVKRSIEKSVRFADVTNYAYKNFGQTITSKVLYNPSNTVPPDHETGYGNTSPTYSFCAHAAEVEVDPETGKVNVINFVAAHDIGKAINPMLIEGQIEGGIAMGLGYALLEEIKLYEGNTLNPSFSGYKTVNAPETPTIKHILIETLDPDGPFGAKGVGEIAMVPTAPAIVNAIQNAIGVRIKELPISQEKILLALKEKSIT